MLFPNNEEIALNIRAASERLTAAEFLMEKGLFSDTVNRAYYAMFHAANAILLTRSIIVKTHTGLITQFGQAFILTGEIDKEYGRMLANAEELREKADYSVNSDITKEQAEYVLHDAGSFLKMVKSRLKTIN